MIENWPLSPSDYIPWQFAAAEPNCIGVCFIPVKFGVPEHAHIIVLGLISLATIKGVLLASGRWDHFSRDSFDMGILPLFVCFLALLFFKFSGIIFME